MTSNHEHRHIRIWFSMRNAKQVTEPCSERWAALAGFVACAAIGVPVVLQHLDGESRLEGLVGAWWRAVGRLLTDPAPLRSALQTLALDLPEPAIHVDVDDDLDLAPDVAFALVRCAQEIMTNTARHAGADNLWLEVARQPDGATTLRATDDGRGCPDLRLGNGLTGMVERIDALGGSVSFDHTDGFTVTARVPGP